MNTKSQCKDICIQPDKDTLSEDLKKSFRCTLKKGIYKELHQRKLLSDAQLNDLLNEK